MSDAALVESVLAQTGLWDYLSMDDRELASLQHAIELGRLAEPEVARCTLLVRSHDGQWSSGGDYPDSAGAVRVAESLQYSRMAIVETRVTRALVWTCEESETIRSRRATGDGE